MPATPQQLAVMAEHYVIAAIWADCPDGTHPRATAQARAVALERCQRFVEFIGPLFDAAIACKGYGSHPDCGTIEPACAAMGHDLYLTSAGHGAGFWDRDALQVDELGDALTAACRNLRSPEPQFYRGWLYFH